MKIMFASDIHGDSKCTEMLLSRFKAEEAEKLILLGDILYHGPRNSLPDKYNPRKVASLLNANKSSICCVRGNCDSEVDQMVIDFPIMSDSMLLFDRGRTFFITHGHKFNMQTPPPLAHGDLLIHGHTHVKCFTNFGDGNIYINPGSVSLPKENNPRTYMVYEDGVFEIKTLDGEIVDKLKI